MLKGQEIKPARDKLRHHNVSDLSDECRSDPDENDFMKNTFSHVFYSKILPGIFVTMKVKLEKFLFLFGIKRKRNFCPEFVKKETTTWSRGGCETSVVSLYSLCDENMKQRHV